MHSDVCWMCRKNNATQWNGRCTDCEINRCVNCGEHFTKIAKLLDFNTESPFLENVCINKKCFAYINVRALSTWKVITKNG